MPKGRFFALDKLENHDYSEGKETGEKERARTRERRRREKLEKKNNGCTLCTLESALQKSRSYERTCRE